jgi:Na+/H+ antiporter NhaD/arsenite permease-like protein
MDINHQYAAHQRALMRASTSKPGIGRNAQLWLASTIASDIGEFQSTLGAAASCAWITASMRPAKC